MNRIFLIPLLIILIGCANNLQVEQSDHITPTARINVIAPKTTETDWAVYDSNPDHLWNRLFRQFYERKTNDGKEYGADELDPLLWFDTTYLLEGPSHLQALQVLDEFLTTRAENLIQDPLKRAMFQRDMWAVFDWLSFPSEAFPSQRQALQIRLAQVIKRLALTRDEILSLPDNYQLTVESKLFPTEFQEEAPEEAFLPADLFQPTSAWIPMGREGGPVAMAHTEGFPFIGRSVFLVFVRSPDGRADTLDFIHSLNTEPDNASTTGLDIALVRQMLLIDRQGTLVLSPLIETVQIRHFKPEQIFYEFELDRINLLNGHASSLRPNIDLFLLFFSHGDVFEGNHGPELQATIPQICKACHLEHPPLPNPGNTQSILSYSRLNFPFPDNQQPVLRATTWELEAHLVTEWKTDHRTWQSLEGLWHTIP